MFRDATLYEYYIPMSFPSGIESTLYVFLPDDSVFLPSDHGLDYVISLLCRKRSGVSSGAGQRKQKKVGRSTPGHSLSSFTYGDRSERAAVQSLVSVHNCYPHALYRHCPSNAM